MSGLTPTDFLVLPIKGTDLIAIFRGDRKDKPLFIRWSEFQKIIQSLIPPAPPGSAAWGSILPGTGVPSQADLVAYLAANYYPLLSNPAGYIDSATLAAALASYVTTSALALALANYVPTSRTLTINGVTYDLSADRSWTVSGGTAAWGGILPGTGVGSQADLVAYLAANYYPLVGNPSSFITAAALAPYLTIAAAAATYYPLTNPSGFITAAALAPYLTIASAAATYTPLTRSINTAKSITGGGNLSADRTIELVNDETSPSANKYYGTNSAGTRGFHVFPFTAAIYPYQLKNYYRAYFIYSLVLYNNTVLHACYNASPTTGGNNSINVDTTDSLNTVTFASGMYNQLVTITGSDEIWATSVGVTTIQRLVASTGAFIANTAITGVLTTSQATRFVQFNSSKVFIANTTNYAALNSSFVTSSLTAHGLGSIPYFAVNNNGSSAQNGTVMLVGTNGLVLVNGSTNAIAVSVTTLSGAIGTSVDVVYDSTNDKWIIITTVSGNPRIVYLTPATATTFTVFETITEFTSLGVGLTPGNALTAKLLLDAAKNYLFVVTNGMIQQYVLTTGAFIKSLNFRMASTGAVSAAAIDTTNRLLYVTSANGNACIITQFQYE